MAKFGGVLGKLSDDIFNKGAEDGRRYLLKNKLFDYAGAGSLVGAMSTMAANLVTDSDEDIYRAGLRGSVTGAVVGAGVNVIPKALHNQLAKTGMRKFQGSQGIIDDMAKIWAPVFHEFDTKKGRSDPTGFFKDTWKEAGKAVGKGHAPGERAMTLHNMMIQGVDPALKKGDKNLDAMLKLQAFKVLTDDAFKKTSEYQRTNPDFNQFKEWGKEQAKLFYSLGKKDRMTIGYNLLAQAGFASTYNHIVKPTGEFIENIRKGNFKGINLEQGAATAFSAYGIYETAKLVDEVSDGEWGSAAKTAAMLAGGKLAYGMGVEAVKLDAKRRAHDISYASIGKALRTANLYGQYTKDLGQMTAGQFRNNQVTAQNKVLDILGTHAPNTYKALGPNRVRLLREGTDFMGSFQEGLNYTMLAKAAMQDVTEKGHGEAVNAAIDRGKWYMQNYADDISKIKDDFKFRGLHYSLGSFRTEYSNFYNDLHKDIIHSSQTFDYDSFITDLAYGDMEDKISAINDLVYKTKLMQNWRNK